MRLLSLAFLAGLLVVADATVHTAAAQTTLSWAALGRVRMNGGTPRFDAPVQRLDGRAVRLTGYMLPLEQSASQQHFLLTAQPMADCFYCIPSGPESFVEVRLAAPMRFTYDRITITGRLSLLTDDPIGLYRIAGGRARAAG